MERVVRLKCPPTGGSRGPSNQNGCGAAGNFTDGFTRGAPRGPKEAPRGPKTVNPPVELPAAPQPFWLEGPLEPPVGGHFHLTTRSKELVSQHLLPRGRIPFIESLSFLERECCSTSSGQDRRRGLSVLEEGKDHHGPNRSFTDCLRKTQYAINQTTAHSHTLSRLSTLQTNPHW